MHLLHTLLPYFLCLLTRTRGANCPEACACTDTNLNCANQFLHQVPHLDGTFQHISFSRNKLTSLGTSNIHLDGPSCSIDYSYNQLSRGISNLSPNCNQLLANFSHNNFQDSLPSHFIISNSGPNVTIDLSFNQLQRVHEKTFTLFNSRCINIDLSHNIIYHIDPNAFELKFHVTSVHLKLSYNRITTSIFQLTVYRFSNEIHLDVSENLLTHLPVTFINSGSNLRINLARNPWSCDCRQSWIADPINGFHRVLLNDPGVLLCDHPPNMRNRPVLELSLEEFSCPPELDRDADLHINADLGGEYILQCPFRGAVPPVQLINWTFVPGAKPASSGVISFSTPSDTLFQIHNVTCERAGTYFCEVENIGGNIRLNVTLSVNSLCKNDRLTWLCVALAVLQILSLAALVFACTKSSRNSYVFRTNQNQLSSTNSGDIKVALAEVVNKEDKSTASVTSQNENGEPEKTNFAVHSDISSKERTEQTSQGKRGEENNLKFLSEGNRQNTDCTEATQVNLIIQAEEEQEQDQVYFPNCTPELNQEAKKTAQNVTIPLLTKEMDDVEMDEDLYLVPNDNISMKGPYRHSDDNPSRRNSRGKQTRHNKEGQMYLVPDQNSIPKSSPRQIEDIPAYLAILPDKQMPSFVHSVANVKTTGLQTKPSQADNVKRLKHKKKPRHMEETRKKSQGKKNSEAIPWLMEEYMKKKNKGEMDEDENVYSDVKSLENLCNDQSREVKERSKTEAETCNQNEDDLDEELYVIPNQPR